jgi:hypothetical protein
MSNDAPFIRPVPQQFPGTALSGAQTNLLGSLSFPDAGGVQGVDKTGAVLNLAGAGGAVTATVTDAVTNGSSTALSLVHALSAGVGATGIGVTQRFILPNSLGVAASAGQFTVSYTDATSGSEDSALGITLQVGGAGTGVLTVTAPTAGVTTLTAAGSATASLNLVGAGGIAIAPTVVTSGSQTAFKVTSAANTTQAAGVNAPAVDLNLAATVQFATGAMAALTAIRVSAPTYTFVGASTVTNAATLYIDAAPSVTAPSTATNSYAILVAAGNVRFGDNIITGGNLSFAGAAPSISATAANEGVALVPNGKGGITVRNSGDTATIFGVQSVASGNYAPTMWASDESGTPGAAVIHRPSGQVAVAIGASSVTVTNDLVTATSVVIATLQSYDATFTQILSVVPGAGSFVITGNAVADAPTKIGFIVINPSSFS